MNRFLKKAAAVMTAGILTASAMGMTAFADEAKLIYSTEASVSYNAAVAKPVFSVKGSKGVRQIKLTTTTKGASIYYTTNGSTPTTSSKKLASNSLIQIKKKTTIKAIAVSGSSKSAVMTKTFSVDTIPGDVTGDGNINSSDYTRLKNYLNGKTKYICKDNADVSGDGSVANKDLTLISQYLNGQIKKFPASGSSSSSTSSVTKPTSTVTSTYGGKNVELKCSDSSAKIYYTTNGKTPTSSSTLYKSKFLVTKDTTVKFISYKSGKSSSVQSRTVEVSQCKAVTSDTPTNKIYDKSITVKLSCPTSSTTKIYYTLDGSNPMTSYSAMLYGNSGITISKDTVVKAYARAKGYSDSNVSTFSYSVESNSYFTISGNVWDDTPNESATPDGKRGNGENGINGLTVYLINTNGNVYEASTTTTTINGVIGSYTFNKAIKGQKYKVAFQFNGQKYRAYDYVVNGGNQASNAAISASDTLTIDNTGARNAGGTVLFTENSYSKAIASNKFEMLATTSYTYTTDTKDVNCALVSTVYGKMKLSLAPTKVGNVQYNSTTTVNSGNSVIYELALTNNSPSANLSSASIRLYVPTSFDRNSVLFNNTTANCTSTSGSYNVYTINNAFNQTISKGATARATIQANVGDSVSSGASLTIYAEVINYKYANSAYDYSVIPGNLTVPNVRENDEASATVKVSGTSKSLISADAGKTVSINIGQTYEYKVTVKNGNNLDIDYSSLNDSIKVEYAGSTPSGSDSVLTFYIKGISETTRDATVTVFLKSDSSKKVETNFRVVKPAVTLTASATTSSVDAGGTFMVSVTINNAVSINNPVNAVPVGAEQVGEPSNPNPNTSSMTVTYQFRATGTDRCSITFTSVDQTSATSTVIVTINPAPAPAPDNTTNP